MTCISAHACVIATEGVGADFLKDAFEGFYIPMNSFLV